MLATPLSLKSAIPCVWKILDPPLHSTPIGVSAEFICQIRQLCVIRKNMNEYDKVMGYLAHAAQKCFKQNG